MRQAGVCILVLLAQTLAVLGQNPRPGRVGFGSGGSTAPASAVALVTWMFHRTEQGPDPGLVVIWRGSPGWFYGKGSSGGSGGGSRDAYNASLRYGDVDLSFSLTFQPRALKILETPVEIGANTVVLVDDVDGADGPRVVTTLPLDLSGITSGMDLEQLGSILRESAQASAFLKCEVFLPRPPGMPPAMTPLCQAIAGR
jgi:hypothetical protein